MKTEKQLRKVYEVQKRRWEEDHSPKLEAKRAKVKALEEKLARVSRALEEARNVLKKEEETRFPSFLDFQKQQIENSKKSKEKSSKA